MKFELKENYIIRKNEAIYQFLTTKGWNEYQGRGVVITFYNILKFLIEVEKEFYPHNIRIIPYAFLIV